jgi:hypothetical protein
MFGCHCLFTILADQYACPIPIDRSVGGLALIGVAPTQYRASQSLQSFRHQVIRYSNTAAESKTIYRKQQIVAENGLCFKSASCCRRARFSKSKLRRALKDRTNGKNKSLRTRNM